MDSSFIICTKDRHKDIVKCISSILRQTVLPKELIVIDAGCAQDLKEIIADLLQGSKIEFIYSSTRPNTPYQRNVGIELASGNIIFFFDDDVLLDEDYHEKIMEVYSMDKDDEVGGVTGIIKNPFQNPLLGKIFRRIFCLEGWDDRFPKSPSFRIDNNILTPICSLMGCQMSFRKKILQRYKFDVNMGKISGYAFLEDNELAYRVAQEYVLLKTVLAKVHHSVSPIARDTVCKLEEIFVVNFHYIFMKDVPKNIINCMVFLWQEIGIMLHAIAQTIRKGDIGWITGVLKGYRRLLFYRKG